MKPSKLIEDEIEDKEGEEESFSLIGLFKFIYWFYTDAKMFRFDLSFNFFFVVLKQLVINIVFVSNLF